MKVRALFIHPISGIHDALIEDAESVEEVRTKLEEADCGILIIEEEVSK